MKIIRKSLLALLLGLSLTACGISRNKIINTEFTRATEAESQVSQFVSGTPSETTSFMIFILHISSLYLMKRFQSLLLLCLLAVGFICIGSCAEMKTILSMNVNP